MRMLKVDARSVRYVYQLQWRLNWSLLLRENELRQEKPGSAELSPDISLEREFIHVHTFRGFSWLSTCTMEFNPLIELGGSVHPENDWRIQPRGPRVHAPGCVGRGPTIEILLDSA